MSQDALLVSHKKFLEFFRIDVCFARLATAIRPPAVYARKSSEEGLEQEFNSLDAQRAASEAYVASQSQGGWLLVPDRYDDGGISGAMAT